MGRVWLGATHGGRPPEAGAPVAGGRALLPQPAQQHQQRDQVAAGPTAGARPRWLRWLVRNP